MHRTLIAPLTAFAMATSLLSPALAAEPMLQPGVTYVIEADARDASGGGMLTLRAADEQGAPAQGAAPTTVEVHGCDGELGQLARIEPDAAAGMVRTFAAATSDNADAAVTVGEPKASCQLGEAPPIDIL